MDAAWCKRLACTGVGDVWIPVWNLAAATGIDAVAVDAVGLDVVPRDVFHVVDPAWPVEIEAPIIERGAIFLLKKPFRMIFSPLVGVGASMRDDILYDMEA